MTVMRAAGSVNPHERMAANTRSLASRTAPSASPTITKAGIPFRRKSTSKSTRKASTPCNAPHANLTIILCPLRNASGGPVPALPRNLSCSTPGQTATPSPYITSTPKLAYNSQARQIAACTPAGPPFSSPPQASFAPDPIPNVPIKKRPNDIVRTRPAGKTGNRDSINTEAFREGA